MDKLRDVVTPLVLIVIWSLCACIMAGLLFLPNAQQSRKRPSGSSYEEIVGRRPLRALAHLRAR